MVVYPWNSHAFVDSVVLFDNNNTRAVASYFRVVWPKWGHAPPGKCCWIRR